MSVIPQGDTDRWLKLTAERCPKGGCVAPKLVAWGKDGKFLWSQLATWEGAYPNRQDQFPQDGDDVFIP